MLHEADEKFRTAVTRRLNMARYGLPFILQEPWSRDNVEAKIYRERERAFSSFLPPLVFFAEGTLLSVFAFINLHHVSETFSSRNRDSSQVV